LIKQREDAHEGDLVANTLLMARKLAVGVSPPNTSAAIFSSREASHDIDLDLKERLRLRCGSANQIQNADFEISGHELLANFTFILRYAPHICIFMIF